MAGIPISTIDRLLRRDLPPGAPRAEGGASVTTLLILVLALGALYGLAMGLYAPLRTETYGLDHTIAVMVKVPALFLLTLGVTAPSLYVFSAIAGSPLGFRAMVRLLLAATVVTCAVLASLATVTAFFTFSTESHPFLQVMNAAAFAVAGLVGLASLRASIEQAFEGQGRQPRRPVTRVFLAWLVVYGLVAAQMGWLLRPFIGAPGRAPALFRATESNVFEGLLEALKWL